MTEGNNSNIPIWDIENTHPELVPLVEEGWWDNEVTELVARKYLEEY